MMERLCLGDYITKEELFACTTCNACIEACPVTYRPGFHHYADAALSFYGGVRGANSVECHVFQY